MGHTRLGGAVYGPLRYGADSAHTQVALFTALLGTGPPCVALLRLVWFSRPGTFWFFSYLYTNLSVCSLCFAGGALWPTTLVYDGLPRYFTCNSLHCAILLTMLVFPFGEQFLATFGGHWLCFCCGLGSNTALRWDVASRRLGVWASMTSFVFPTSGSTILSRRLGRLTLHTLHVFGPAFLAPAWFWCYYHI